MLGTEYLRPVAVSAAEVNDCLGLGEGGDDSEGFVAGTRAAEVVHQDREDVMGCLYERGVGVGTGVLERMA